MDYRNYVKRINEKIGEIKAADRIQEDPWWNTVVKVLNETKCETGSMWNKGSYITGLDEAPPARLLALEIALAGWLGWIMHEKHGDTYHFL